MENRDKGDWRDWKDKVPKDLSEDRVVPFIDSQGVIGFPTC